MTKSLPTQIFITLVSLGITTMAILTTTAVPGSGIIA